MLLVVSTEIKKPFASHQKHDLALAPVVSLELVFSEWSRQDSIGTNACKARGCSYNPEMALLGGLKLV